MTVAEQFIRLKTRRKRVDNPLTHGVKEKNATMKKFKRLSALIECSSGITPKPETVKKYIKILSGMGYDKVYLGMADAYKIKEEPYFGYKRGGYTVEQLKDMDGYAKNLGVELVSQIQTLSHLHFLSKFPEYQGIFDTDNVVLVGCDRVYELIENMIKTVSEGISSRCIHLGLDEAFGLGTGEYLKKFGKADKKELIKRHLERVFAILDKYGYNAPEMWGDMITEKDETSVSANDIKNFLPKNSRIFVWNYEEKDEKALSDMYFEAKNYCDNIGYAGAVWKYIGFGPNNKFSISRLIPQMRAMEKCNADEFMVTLWADRISPCSNYAALPSLFAVAEFNEGVYDGTDEKTLDKEKFLRLTGVNYDDMFALDYIDNPLKTDSEYRSNSSFWIFYTDLLLGNFDAFAPDNAGEYYAALAERYAKSTGGEFSSVFKTSESLMRTLEIKVSLPRKIRAAYLGKDKKKAEEAIGELAELKKRTAEFIKVFEEYYAGDNQPFGIEVHQLYMNGQIARIEYATERLGAFIESGEIIEELEGGILPLNYYPPVTLDCSCMTDFRMLLSYCLQ